MTTLIFFLSRVGRGAIMADLSHVCLTLELGNGELKDGLSEHSLKKKIVSPMGVPKV